MDAWHGTPLGCATLLHLAVEYDEMEADHGMADKPNSKTYLYGTFKESADA